MNQLVLRDYLRRKRWVLGIGAALFFALNWGHDSHSGQGWTRSFSVFHYQIALFCGPLLLSMDLKRGYARALHSLPITALGVGRAWWVGAVLVPAIAATGLIFAAAALADVVSSGDIDYALAAHRAGMVALLLGGAFGLLHTFPFRPGHGWKNPFALLAPTLGGLLMVAGYFTTKADDYPWLKVAALMAAGTLTWRGWKHADATLRNIAGLPATNAAAWAGWSKPRTTAPRPAALDRLRYGGVGGLTRWMLRSCAWVLMGITGLILIKLTAHLLIDKRDLHVVLLDYAKSDPFWALFLPMLGLLPALGSLRALRTLPIGPGRLAACLLATFVLPVIIAALVHCAVAHLLHGPDVQLKVMRQLFYGLGVASLVTPVAVWRGVSWWVYVIMMGGMFVGIYTFTFIDIARIRDAAPVGTWTPGFALAAIVLGWFFTRLVLTGSRHAYQRPSNPLMAWQAGMR